jgi:hypothetical protein
MKHISDFKLFEQVLKHFNYKIIKTEPIDNLKNYKYHRRLKVFYHKGLECANPDCDRKGTMIVHGQDKGGGMHVDISTDDYIPMNVDHILPKSKGGSNNIKNLQPMCYICNTTKGNQIPDNVEYDPNFSNRKYIKPYEIKIGDTVYKKYGRKGKMILLGKVVEILPNEKHPKKAMSAKIEDMGNSMFTLSRLYIENEKYFK